MTKIFQNSDIQKFNKQDEIKIENKKLLFDKDTTNLSFVSIGQYEGKDNDGIVVSSVEFLSEQTNLQYLDLSYQPLKKLTIKNCPNLKVLYLYNCELEEVVFEGEFPKLELIDLSNNKLTTVNLQKQNFPALQNFFINKNKIESLSFLSPFIINNDYFDFGIIKNPLIEPPEATVKQGNDAVRNWYEQQNKYGSETLYDAKIIIVGEPGAGKTTLRHLLAKKTIKVPATAKEQPSTHGINVEKNVKFLHSHLKNIKITTNIWDFGGQDIQYNLHHYFLSSDALYILVTDLRAEKTRFTYWFQAINFFGSKDIPIIILKNDHGDAGSNDISIEQYRRDFPDIAKNFEEIRLNLGKIETENKKDWETLNNYFIPKQLEELKTVGSKGVRIWSEIRNEFEKEKEPYIEFGNLFDIAQEKGMKSEEDVKYMLKYFHNIGIIIYYEEDRFLDNYVFIKPEWITENLYTALTESNISEKGIFEDKKLFDFWQQKKINFKQRKVLLELMGREKFDVAYPLYDNKYAVPIMFEDKALQHDDLSGDILYLKFKFEKFLPKGLLSRFIVRMYENIEHNNNVDLAWKTGVVLRKNGTRAFVIELTDEKTIDIQIAGTDKIRFRSSIIETFEKLFERYPSKPDLFIPCNCEKCIREPKFFTYNDLLDFVNSGDKIQCIKSRKMIDPSELLNGFKMFDKENIRRPQDTHNIEINIDNSNINSNKSNNTNVVGNDNISVQDANAKNINIIKEQKEEADKKLKIKEEKEKQKKKKLRRYIFWAIIIVLAVTTIIAFVVNIFYPSIWSWIVPYIAIVFLVLPFLQKILTLIKTSIDIADKY